MISTGETVLGGIVVAVTGMLVGRVLNGKNKVTDDQCKERHEACITNVCIKLDHLKEEQAEMRNDIKELLKR